MTESQYIEKNLKDRNATKRIKTGKQGVKTKLKKTRRKSKADALRNRKNQEKDTIEI